MSLIRVRRERKEEVRGGPGKPPSIAKLLAAFVLVVLAIWYLSRFA